MAYDPAAPPPLPPQRRLDTISLENLADLVDETSPDKEHVKSRDFPELLEVDVRPSDIKVVLYDAMSVDSFAACLAARKHRSDGAQYEGVDRSKSVEDLTVDVTGQVVAMLGVFWSLEAMHDLMTECSWLIVLATQASVARELVQFSYPNAVRIVELDMSAGALAWNFFFQGEPVPPLLRALEDAELGRRTLRGAIEFADGFMAALDIRLPKGELQSTDAAFEEFDLLLDGRGLASIDRAINAGAALRPSIQQQCMEAEQRRVVRSMREFPAWRCVLVHLSSPFAGRVAEHLTASFAATCNGASAMRVFSAVFEVRQRQVWAVLRSMPGGPDVSEIAGLYEGSGNPTRAFMSIPIEMWEEIWVRPEPVLWDWTPTSPCCLELKRGELVTVARKLKRGELVKFARKSEHFKESADDFWSWGYKESDPAQEGWMPTFAHTLFIATTAVPSAGPGIHPVEEGDLLVARGQKGNYLFGTKQIPGSASPGVKGWFPHTEGVWRPVHPLNSQAMLARAGA